MENIRVYDGCTEHKHDGYDYWHPKVRVHKEEGVLQMSTSNERVKDGCTEPKHKYGVAIPILLPHHMRRDAKATLVNWQVEQLNKSTQTNSIERYRDGVTEHKHTGFDYWHPKARVHTHTGWSTNQSCDPTETEWNTNPADIADILIAMSGIQTHYNDIFGIAKQIADPVNCMTGTEEMTLEWAVAISKIRDVVVNIDMSNAIMRSVTVKNFEGDEVKFSNGRVYFTAGSRLHKAKLLLESGEAAKYVPYSTLADAAHLLYVLAGGAHFDLIYLPNGGHIPPEILVNEYGVSWDDLAKIPLGIPQDGETFTCPICGDRSFYAGVCQRCSDPCEGCRDDCDDCRGSYSVDAHDIADLRESLASVDGARTKRKEFEHGAILRMIKSGNWKKCRYMRGGN